MQHCLSCSNVAKKVGHLCSLFYHSIMGVFFPSNVSNIEFSCLTVEPQYNKRPRDSQNMLAIKRFDYIVFFPYILDPRVKNIICFTKDFVTQRLIKSTFRCTWNYLFSITERSLLRQELTSQG